MADIRSERWPASDRYGWPASDRYAWPASSVSAQVLGRTAQGNLRRTDFSCFPSRTDRRKVTVNGGLSRVLAKSSSYRRSRPRDDPTSQSPSLRGIHFRRSAVHPLGSARATCSHDPRPSRCNHTRRQERLQLRRLGHIQAMGGGPRRSEKAAYVVFYKQVTVDDGESESRNPTLRPQHVRLCRRTGRGLHGSRYRDPAQP